MSTEAVKKETTENAANGEKDGELPAFASPSLYVGSLKEDVAEGALFEIFNAIGAVASIRVCRDTVTKRSLGYAYVNYHSMEDAARALEELNDTPIKGRNCRVMWSQRDPSLRKNGVGNIFIKNLAADIDAKTLQETFESFGEIRSCKIVTDKDGKSKGYGFVHFVNEADANDAIEKVNGANIAGNDVVVTKFIPRAERLEKQGDPREKFTNVYVKNLPDDVADEAALRKMFEKYGEVTSVHLKTESDGKSKGFGFVNFASSDEAHAAVDDLNEKELGDGKVLYVGRAQKKNEREDELRQKMERKKQELQSKYQGTNVYVKNLDDAVDDDKLREEFKQFGTISSCRVMRDEKNISRGFGFVCFSTPEEATRAVTEMNGKMVANKPIYAALHQRKDERRMQLEAMHARRGKQMPLAVPGMMPGFGAPPGAQMFYAQAAAAGAQNNAQLAAYQQQMMLAQQRAAAANGGVPGWPMMAAAAAAAQQGQFMRGGPQGGMPRGAAPGGRGGVPVQGGGRGGGGVPVQGGGGAGGRGGAPVTAAGRGAYNAALMQQQQLYQQQLLVAQQQAAAQVAAQQQSMQQMVQQPLDPKAISSLPTDQQKLVVGEKLYPLIYAQQPKLAGKITGMLLDSYFTEEVIHLLETPDALAAKVKEAVSVLEKHNAAQ